MKKADDGRDRYVPLPGGSPANVAVGLSRLDVHAYFAGRLSRLAFGPLLRRHFEDNGVDLRFAVDASQPPTLALVTLDGAGRAAYTFYGPETADWQWSLDELPLAHASTAPSSAELSIAAVHTGSLATVFEPGATVIAHWLKALREAGEVLISFDPNVRPGLAPDPEAYLQRVESLVASSHIVKASSDDIAALYGAGAATGRTSGGAATGRTSGGGAAMADLERVAEHWLGLGAQVVIVTEGERGATAFHSKGWRARAEPPPLAIKDTIGAGDSFTSGFLAYLSAADLLAPRQVAALSEYHLQVAVARAVVASAFTCTRAGADPPNSQELEQFLHEHAMS